MTRLELRRMLQRQLARRARRLWTIRRGTLTEGGIALEYMDEMPSVWARPDPGALAKVLRAFRDYERKHDRS